MTATTATPSAAGTRRRPRGEVPFLGIAIPGPLTYRVWQRNRDVFFSMWKSELTPPVLEPILTLFALGLGLGGYVHLGGDLEYLQFLAPGVLVTFAMFAAVFEALFGAYFRMTQHGTYEAIAATPVRPEEIIAGEIAWAASRMALSTGLVAVVLLIGTPWWDFVQSPLIIFTIPVAFVTGITIGGLGIAYTSKAHSISQLTYFFSLFILPMFWLGGGFFPTDSLPGWAQAAAWIFPLSHAVDLSRAMLTGDVYWSHLGDVAWLLVAAFPSTWLGIRMMRSRIVG